MVDFALNATSRNDEGKGASRRLRHANRIPSVIYGGGKDAQSITLELKDVVKALESEAFYSHILTLTVDGVAEKAILRDVQRHPAKNTPMHMDFLRIDESHKLNKKVPLHFINQDICAGVKTGGGAISHFISEVEIQCLPQHLPEYLVVDMKAVALGESVHLSNIKLPGGVVIPALALGHDHDHAVANVHKDKSDNAAPAAE